MAEGYDGQHLVEVLRKILPEGSSVLELDMGPGVDLLTLSKTYQVTGSDNSTVFLERFRRLQPTADLVQLDAAVLDIDRSFDCIYSNKVLHHLTRQELKISFRRQAKILRDMGLLMHSFWFGDKEETYEGLRFVYYTEQSIQDVIGREYEMIEIRRYTEIDPDDSFYTLLRNAAKLS